MDSLYWTSSGNATYIAGAVVCQIAGASPGGLLTVLSQNVAGSWFLVWRGLPISRAGVRFVDARRWWLSNGIGARTTRVRRSSSAAICWPSRRLDRATASSARAGVQALIITPAATCSSRSGIVSSRQAPGRPSPRSFPQP